MPKARESESARLKRFASTFGATVVSTDGKVLYCQLCKCAVNAAQKCQVTHHTETQKHQDVLREARTDDQPPPKQMLMAEAFDTAAEQRKQSNRLLCNMLVKADIPFHKLSNNYFRQYLEEETEHEIPDESTIRKLYVTDMYDETVRKIRDRIGVHSVYFQLDETVDKTGRSVANVLVGALSWRFYVNFLCF